MNFDETPHTGDFFVIFDKGLLDAAFVIKEITTSYWGSWRTPMVVLRSIDHSLCAGVYLRQGEGKPDRQVGFARVVTDYTTFAWICDVVITKDFRGKGLGSFLMRTLMEHPDVKPRACLLSTQDAHELYAKFGFRQFVAMKRLPPTKAGE